MAAGLATTLLLLSEACAVIAVHPVPIGRLPLAPVPYSNNSGLIVAETHVIREAQAWSDAWSRIHSIRRPSPALPQIDFTSQMVLIAALGRRATGGFAIVISNVTQDGDTLVVDVDVTQPGSGCIVTSGFTAAVDIAIVPRSDTDPVFRESTSLTDCQNLLR